MKIPAILGSTLVLLFASTSSSQAVAVAILNQSFENPGGGSFSYPPANNWITSSFTEISTDVGLSGGHLLRHNGQNPGSSASQDLGVGFLTDSIYTLTISIGNRTTDVNNPTGTAVFGLTAGGTDQAVFTQVASSLVPGGTFRDFTYTFTTGAVAPTGNVGIRLGAAVGGRGLFDNVRLDVSPVPEPGTTLFALLGGLLIARRRRCR